MAAGEVLLNGTQLGTGGSGANLLSNLLDGNNQTYWQTPSSTAFAGMDAGAPCILTRVRLSTLGGSEDDVIGGVINGSSSPGFLSQAPSFVQGNFNSQTSAGSISCPFTSNNTAGNLIAVFLESNGSAISISDSTGAAATAGFVQGNYNGNLTGGSLSCAFNSSNTASNCIVVFVSTNGSLASVTDTAGNNAKYLLTATLTSQLYAYVAPNIVAGANTVTANVTGGTSTTIQILEYKGIATVSPVDAIGTATSTGTTSSVSVTTGNANDVLICATGSTGSLTMVAGSGFTIRTSYAISHTTGASSENQIVEDRIVSLAGEQIATASWTGSGTWFTMVVALKRLTNPAVNNYSLVTVSDGDIYTYVAPNIVGGANTVTVAITGGTASTLMILEYSGIAASNPVDTFSTGLGTAATSSSVSLTTNNSSDLLISAVVSGGTDTIAAGAGFTIRSSYNSAHASGALNVSGAVQDALASSLGTYTSTDTWTGSYGWAMVFVALKSAVGSFNVTGLYSIGSRPVTGTLLNEYDITAQSTAFRYFQYLPPIGVPGKIADLDFIVQYTSGVVGQVVTPTVTPPGGDYDQPTIVRISSITTDAVFYYTLDGSTPTFPITGTTVQYSGPIVIKANCTLNAIGASLGLSNSRVANYIFHVPSAFISTDQTRDNRNYPIGFQCINPAIFFDPIGRWWWMYGVNMDEPGVLTSGVIGLNVYRSADLRNWAYAGVDFGPSTGQETGTASNFAYRPSVLYNAVNNNYVVWLNGAFGTYVYTSPTPSGPFTLAATYATLVGYPATGDHGLFIDPNDGLGGITAYVIQSVATNATIIIARLTTDYQNVDGVNYITYPNTSAGPFGQASEAYSMFYAEGWYFWMASGQTAWQPNQNLCVSNIGGPLAAWGVPFNPFVNATIPETPQETAVGIVPSYLNAYDSQNVSPVLQIPGRNALIYIGDRYETGLTSPTLTSSVANFWNYRRLTLPITLPTTSTISIAWNDDWSLDGEFPTVTGAPGAVTGLVVAGSIATWVNNEPSPAYIYLDNSNDPTFATGVSSEVLSPGSDRFGVTFQPGLYFRLRTVNANGTTNSSIVQVTIGGGGAGGSVSSGTNIRSGFSTPPLTGSAALSNMTALVGSELWQNNGNFQFSFDAQPNTVLDILQQLYNLWSVPLGSQVNQRAFGTDQSWIDLPGNIATMQAQTAFLLSAAKWIPQCSFSKIQFTADTAGILSGRYNLYCELTIDLTRTINTQLFGPPGPTSTWVIYNPMDGVIPDVELDNVTI